MAAKALQAPHAPPASGADARSSRCAPAARPLPASVPSATAIATLGAVVKPSGYAIVEPAGGVVSTATEKSAPLARPAPFAAVTVCAPEPGALASQPYVQ